MLMKLHYKREEEGKWYKSMYVIVNSKSVISSNNGV